MDFWFDKDIKNLIFTCKDFFRLYLNNYTYLQTITDSVIHNNIKYDLLKRLNQKDEIWKLWKIKSIIDN